jgi:hypothetical protein
MKSPVLSLETSVSRENVWDGSVQLNKQSLNITSKMSWSERVDSVPYNVPKNLFNIMIRSRNEGNE